MKFFHIYHGVVVIQSYRVLSHFTDKETESDNLFLDDEAGVILQAFEFRVQVLSRLIHGGEDQLQSSLRRC